MFSLVISDEDWYGYLCNSLHTTSPDEFYKNRLSIITFNYDRSLEQYLFKALENFYPETSASELIQTIDIIHMYGKLDHLPQEDWKEGKKREYGSIPSGQSLIDTSKGITLIHESKEQGSFKEAHKLLGEVRRIYFLGFGYNKNNLENLNIRNQIRSQGASGTGFKLPQSIKNTFTTYNNRLNVDNNNVDCLMFLNNHGL